MIIYTIGFTKKNAKQFFEPLRENGVQLLIDVRLNNKSQLAGFTKDGDIQYFLQEICNVEYVHCDEFAPSKELLKSYQAGQTSWAEYVTIFDEQMEKRGSYKKFLTRFSNYDKVCLLCSEPTPEQCHRRLVAEKVRSTDPNNVEVIHL